jgi:hypothetical protein
MSKRQIKDAKGTTWDVWDVIPNDVLAGTSYDRRRGERAEVGPHRPGLSLQPELEAGWLCFQAGSERRRFAPIPPGWFELPDPAVRVMLETAAPVQNSGDPNRPPATSD